MAWILSIGLLLCGVYAASPFCLDGEKDLVVGTRCRKFVECESGRWYLKQCQVGQQFDSRTRSCVKASALGCKHGNAKCKEGKTFSHPGSDSLYYLCQNGRINTKFCGAAEVFDHETEQCRLIDRLADSHAASGRNRRSADPACVEENVKRRDGKSCQNYLECINGQLINKSCPNCMNFDEVHQSCRFNMILPCGPNSDMPTLPPPTTPEPTTPKPTSPQPTSAAPTTPAPITPEPITDQPTTPAPITPEPITGQPTTPAPVTPEPKTPPPVTPEPKTPAPVTPEPKTPAPVKPEPKP